MRKNKAGFISTVVAWILAVAALMTIIVASAVGMRKLSEATTTIEIIEAEPGVHCARMVTADGAAIDCWKVGGGE